MRLPCKKTSRLLSLVIPEGVQQWQAGPACAQGWLWYFLALEARAGMQIWWQSSDQVVVPLLFLTICGAT